MDFDPNEVEDNGEGAGDFELLPNGDYRVVIVDSRAKPNSKANGHYLELEFDVLDGKFEGRKLWDRINIDHPDAATVARAKRDLKRYCDAVGHATKLTSSSQLHDKPLTIRVINKKRKDTGEPSNEVKGPVKPKADSQVSNQRPATGATGGTSQPPSDSKPWLK